MSRRHRVVRATVLAGAAALACAACTAVPASSSPQIIAPVGNGGALGQRVVPPPKDADQRTIVEGFLQANGENDLHHTNARAYLTPAAKSRWSDTTSVTIIDNERASLVGANGRVTVTGTEVGTLDQSGVYTPSLRGDGTGANGAPVSRQFGTKLVNGQWRINAPLQNGLLISDTQFAQYRPFVVYFFDLAEKHLVPEPRYSQLTEPALLSKWLIGGLANGPVDTLQGAEQTELPQQTDPNRVRVDLRGAPDPSTGERVTTIEIPGASKLARGTRDRLAAQIAETLSQVGGAIDEMRITDGGVPVTIPGIGRSIFRAADVVTPYSSTFAGSQLYYLHHHGVVDAQGRPLPGRVGNGAYNLSSVALRDGGDGGGLLVAGVRPDGNASVLDVGSVSRGLVATTVRGELSRPEWAPDRNEIWIGDGPRLYRVTPQGHPHVVLVNAASGRATGRVTAVRISPEGTRVALVLTNANSTAQIWIGAIVRGSGKVRIDDLTPISPQGVTVTDVAWNDEQLLFTIGHDQRTGSSNFWAVACDGSRWTPRGTGSLPNEPQSITVAANVLPAVSVGSTVWTLNGSAWVSLRGDVTHGRNPIYLE